MTQEPRTVELSEFILCVCVCGWVGVCCKNWAQNVCVCVFIMEKGRKNAEIEKNEKKKETERRKEENPK